MIPPSLFSLFVFMNDVFLNNEWYLCLGQFDNFNGLSKASLNVLVSEFTLCCSV